MTNFAMRSSNKAEKSNATLQPFEVLIGTWSTEGSHPYIPGKALHGRSTFEWVCGGAFILWRSQIIDDERFPDAVAVFGGDDEISQYFMLYFDERDVSRKYDVSFENNVLRWQRNAHGLSQRMLLTIAEDRNTIASNGEMSRNGGAWEPDLQLTYSRAA